MYPWLYSSAVTATNGPAKPSSVSTYADNLKRYCLCWVFWIFEVRLRLIFGGSRFFDNGRLKELEFRWPTVEFSWGGWRAARSSPMLGQFRLFSVGFQSRQRIEQHRFFKSSMSPFLISPRLIYLPPGGANVIRGQGHPGPFRWSGAVRGAGLVLPGQLGLVRHCRRQERFDVRIHRIGWNGRFPLQHSAGPEILQRLPPALQCLPLVAGGHGLPGHLHPSELGLLHRGPLPEPGNQAGVGPDTETWRQEGSHNRSPRPR